MQSIFINFIEVSPQDFNIPIYTKEYDGVKIDDDQVFCAKLPNAENLYQQYYVCFEERPQFQAQIVQSTSNKRLSLKYLFYLTDNRLKSLVPPLPYFEEPGVIKRICFTIEESKLADVAITLTPYHYKFGNKIGFLINYKVKCKSGIYNKEVQRLSLSLDENYRSNRSNYADKYNKIANFLRSDVLAKVFPIRTEACDITLSTDFTLANSKSLKVRNYLFGDKQKHSSQFLGVKYFGPYTKLENQVQFVFLFEEKLRMFANELFLSLIGKTYPGTFPGMSQFFGIELSKNNVNKVNIKSYEKDQLEKAVFEITQIKNNNPDKNVIAIFIEPCGEISTSPHNSTYYILKYLMTKAKIPLQVVNYERRSSNEALKWSVANISLQIFAKLGGIPWLVIPANDNCLILGIGSIHYKDNNNQLRRHISYTVCLDSSGLYDRVEVLADDTNYDNYLVKLQKRLQILLSNLNGKYSKVALHLPFKIKRKEINALNNAITNFGKIEFTVIKINTKNDFFGVSDHNTKVPYESTYIQLSKSEYLVWLKGLHFGKELVSERIPNPVHIQFLKVGSQEPDAQLHYLQDVLNLSGVNWRGFNSKLEPISIYYSELLSRYSEKFNQFDDYDETTLNNNLPWFL